MRVFRQGEILSHLILFARRLKERGLKITPSRVMDAARSLGYVDLSNRDDFSMALKTNFTSCRKDLPIYEELFEQFWVQIQEILQKRAIPPAGEPGGEETLEEEIDWISEGEEEPSEEEGAEGERLEVGYSPDEVLMAKDFSQFLPEDWEILDREFTRLLSQIAMKLSRRREPAAKGREMDFRRTFRKTTHYGGEILDLVRRRRKIKPLKILAICDVSGSMDPSTRFILHFIFGLQRIYRQSEIFVFSTRLTRITEIVKHKRWAEALAIISKQVQDWSGGTRIGHALRTFNDRYARNLGAGSAAVIIISDGWDRGEPELLDLEMKKLKRRARRIIWMNPLLTSPEYRPLCQGMRIALSYLDDFLPATNLKGLEALGEVLVDLARE